MKGSGLASAPPERTRDHPELVAVGRVVVTIEFSREAARRENHAGVREVGNDLRRRENALLVATAPEQTPARLRRHRNVDRHDARRFVVVRRTPIVDRDTVERRLPGRGGPSLRPIEVPLADVVHDERPVLAERRHHASRDLSRELRIDDVAEAVAEQDHGIELLRCAPGAEVSDVELDPTVTSERFTRLCHTLGREIDPDDALDPAREEPMDVPPGAEARQEDRRGQRTDQVEREIGFRGGERVVVVDVRVKLTHDVVVIGDSELLCHERPSLSPKTTGPSIASVAPCTR